MTDIKILLLALATIGKDLNIKRKNIEVQVKYSVEEPTIIKIQQIKNRPNKDSEITPILNNELIEKIKSFENDDEFDLCLSDEFRFEDEYIESKLLEIFTPNGNICSDGPTCYLSDELYDDDLMIYPDWVNEYKLEIEVL